jgi:uncharacterized repeat protein (TIGR02543 family)
LCLIFFYGIISTKIISPMSKKPSTKSLFGLAILASLFCFFTTSLQPNHDVLAAANDAIAIRVMPNPEHLSAARWYSTQGFTGSLQNLEVDGYSAIRDGNTVYVNAANVNGNSFYTNIYVLAFNLGAGNDMADIFGQLLQNFTFNTNLTERGYCRDSSYSSPGASCLRSQDCEAGQYCDSPKAKIVLDTRRLADLADLKALLASHGCADLAQGTYLAGRTLSTWDSWQNVLGAKIPGLPVDPVNRLGLCDAGDPINNAKFDPLTCWDNERKIFALPSGAVPPYNFNLPADSQAYNYVSDKFGENCAVSVSTESCLTCPASGPCTIDPLHAFCPVTSINMFKTQPLGPEIICPTLVAKTGKPYSGVTKITSRSSSHLSKVKLVSFPTGFVGGQIASFDEAKHFYKVYFSSVPATVGSYSLDISASDLAGNTSQVKCQLTVKSSNPFSCGGTLPPHAAMCLDATATGQSYAHDEGCSTPCNYKCIDGYTGVGCTIPPPPSCQGTPPLNATVCSGDNFVGVDTPISLANDCSNVATKCKYTCDADYIKSSSDNSCVVKASCGTASGRAFSSAPTSQLCSPALGTIPSLLTQTGALWTWSCFGGDSAVLADDALNCFALKLNTGVCGSSAGGTFAAPASTIVDPCQSGTATLPIYDDDPLVNQWVWWCNGNDSMSVLDDVKCQANPVHCSVIALDTSKYRYCSTNDLAGTSGPNYFFVANCGIQECTYTCKAGLAYDGTDCSPIVNAVCGTANNHLYADTDIDWGGLTACSAGSGSLPAFPAAGAAQIWQCLGQNTGVDAMCHANRQAPTCTSFTYSSWSQCLAGFHTRLAVGDPPGCIGGNPYTSEACVPTCNDGYCDAGENCSTCAADCGVCTSALVCGTAHLQNACVAPTNIPPTNLCKLGVASPVVGSQPFTWSCMVGAGVYNCTTNGAVKYIEKINKGSLNPLNIIQPYPSGNAYTLGLVNVTTPVGTPIAWSGFKNTKGTTSLSCGLAVLTATVPDPSLSFSGWTNCPTISGNQCTINVPYGIDIEANFICSPNYSWDTVSETCKPLQLLTVTKAGPVATPGVVTVNIWSGQSLDWGSPVTNVGTVLTRYGETAKLTPVVPANASLSWSGCDSVNAGNVCSVLMTAAKNVTATFNCNGNYHVDAVTGTCAIDTYIVTYDGNANTGGSVPVDGVSHPHGSSVVVKGNTSGLVRAGYSFNGWNTATDGSGVSYMAGASIVNISANLILYAKWTNLPTYTVTYNGNGSTGGSAPVDSNTYLSGNAVTVLDNIGTLVRAGYTFNGWNTAANGSGLSYNANASMTMGSANLTLYAKWQPAYTLTYSGNGSTGGTAPVDSNVYHNGDSVTVLNNTGNLVMMGYTFGGWNTAPNGSGTTYAGGASLSMGVGNLTLYAKWIAITFPLTVVKAGTGAGSGSVVPMWGTYYYGASAILTATPAYNYSVTWSGDCVGTGNSCTVTNILAPKNVTATFNPDVRVVYCNGLPANATWFANDCSNGSCTAQITQTWNGSTWQLSNVGSFDTDGVKGTCEYVCSAGYVNVGGVCKLANQTKQSVCAGTFDAIAWANNNGGSNNFTQTSNDGGVTWSAIKNWTFNATAGECNHVCSTHYCWDGSSCNYLSDIIFDGNGVPGNYVVTIPDHCVNKVYISIEGAGGGGASLSVAGAAGGDALIDGVVYAKGGRGGLVNAGGAGGISPAILFNSVAPTVSYNGDSGVVGLLAYAGVSGRQRYLCATLGTCYYPPTFGLQGASSPTGGGSGGGGSFVKYLIPVTPGMKFNITIGGGGSSYPGGVSAQLGNVIIANSP